MNRPIIILLDNTIEMARYSSCLRDSIVEIVNYCRTNPYMLDNEISFISFDGKTLYNTSIDKFEEGHILLRTSSSVTLDGGICSILKQSTNEQRKGFLIIITCSNSTKIQPSTIRKFKDSYIPFIVVCLEQNSGCNWVEMLTNNPRIFHSPLSKDSLSNMFVVPTFYINDNRDPNYIATV